VTIQPKVSIVIPVFNGSDYLREAVDSALAQTYPNIEIVVVNDGSKDGGASERIALSYGDSIRYFSQENGGVASALNRGIVEMSGEYFSWLSHDDLYSPNKISTQMDALAEMGFPDAILYSDWASFSDASDQLQVIRMPAVAPEQFRYFLTTTNVLHGCTLLIPRRAFTACGIFDEALRTTQDYDLWFRMAESFRFMQTTGVLVKGRQHTAQSSVTMKQVALAEINNLLIGFSRRLTSVDLAASGHKSACLVYAEIATSFWQRRFYSAARNVSLMAIGRLRDGSLQAVTLSVFMLSRAVANAGVRFLARWGGSLARSVFLSIKKISGLVQYRLLRFRPPDLQQKFSLIYEGNTFGGKESRSGAGSDLQQTREIRRVLPELIKEFNIQTMMDAPCGDLFWMQTMQLGVKTYIGVDIVNTLIEKNQHDFGNDTREFMCLNLAGDELPCVDLIFCRDCLVHLNFADVQKVLSNFKRSGSRYLLTTTFSGRNANRDLVGKDIWRPLNLQAEPFNLPVPLRLINEKCTEGNGAYTDKSLGLWRLSDI
jgi:hypothetical protein